MRWAASEAWLWHMRASREGKGCRSPRQPQQLAPRRPEPALSAMLNTTGVQEPDDRPVFPVIIAALRGMLEGLGKSRRRLQVERESASG